jgi:hypothetical protein
MTRFKSLKMALKELEPFIRNGRHLATGRPFKQFGGMLSREVLANWQATFSSDPIGGDGIIHHDASGFAVPTEHVFVPPGGAAAAGNIENLILAKIQQKHVKGGGEAYALGKTLVVFLDSGGGAWYPHEVAEQLPDPILFDGIWVVGLYGVVAGEYTYFATRIDLAGTPKWRVRIAPDFDDWTVETIPSALN